MAKDKNNKRYREYTSRVKACLYDDEDTIISAKARPFGL